MSNVLYNTVTPKLEAVIKFVNEDDTTKEVSVKEGQLLTNLVYLENGKTKTVSGVVNVINFVAKATTTGVDGCIHDDESIFDERIKITSLLMDCSEQYDCKILAIPVSQIRDIESVEDVVVMTVAVNGVEYATVAEALENVESGNVLTISSNVEFKEKTTVPEGKVLTLNLNGNKLVVPTVENNYGVIVNGDLTIDGTGNVSTGTFGIGVPAKGKLTINGGDYKTNLGTYLIGSWGTTIINDGNFYAPYCPVNGFDGTVEIYGGNFSNSNDDDEINTIVLGNVKVYGGTFSKPIEEKYCAEGYQPKANEDGTYTVEKVETV